MRQFGIFHLSDSPCLPCQQTEQLSINTIEPSRLVVATGSQNRHGWVKGDAGDYPSLTRQLVGPTLPSRACDVKLPYLTTIISLQR